MQRTKYPQKYSRNDVVLVRYPFTDLSGSKVRPAIVVSAEHISEDIFIVPLTSRISSHLPGEFELKGWKSAGLNVPTAVKRGIYTMRNDLVVRKVGYLSNDDSKRLENAVRGWLGLQ